MQWLKPQDEGSEHLVLTALGPAYVPGVHFPQFPLHKPGMLLVFSVGYLCREVYFQV